MNQQEALTAKSAAPIVSLTARWVLFLFCEQFTKEQVTKEQVIKEQVTKKKITKEKSQIGAKAKILKKNIQFSINYLYISFYKLILGCYSLKLINNIQIILVIWSKSSEK